MDEYEDEDDDTLPCPHCHEPVYEDAEQCPSCGTYLLDEAISKRRPWWVVVGVLVCLAMVLGWIIR